MQKITIKLLKDIVTDPYTRFKALNKLGLTHFMSDEEYLKKKFKFELGYELNLDNPQTFNEKLQWLKIYDRKPEYTVMVDKYLAKKYVADKIGEEYIIPTLGVWDDPNEIDFDKLPDQFVLKCNHNSGSIYICRDKSKLDVEKVKLDLKRGLKQNYFWNSREWSYKDVPRKIIAEKYMNNGGNNAGLTDYKFFCFGGEPKFLYISSGLENHNTAHISFLQLNWEFAEFGRTDYKPFDVLPPKPCNYSELLDVARILSTGTIFLRVDLYEINGKIYFSELTFYPCAGFMTFEPSEWDLKLGQMLKLPINPMR